MNIQVLKSKIHKVTVTEADLYYTGSITIDENLMDAVDLIEFEKVHVLNLNNGERIETYVIKGARDSGIICMNGPAARKMAPGDTIIILSYCSLEYNEAKKFKPSIIFPDKNNKL